MWWMFLIVDVASKYPSCLCSTSNQLNIPSFPPCDYVNSQYPAFPERKHQHRPCPLPRELSPRYCGLQCPPIGSRARNFDKLRHSGPLYLAEGCHLRLNSVGDVGVLSVGDGHSGCKVLLFRPLVCLVGRQVNYFPHKSSHNWHNFTATNLPHAVGQGPRNNISKQSWRHARHAGDSDVHHPPESPGLNLWGPEGW